MAKGTTVTDRDGGPVNCQVCGTPMFYENHGYNNFPTREELKARGDTCSNCRYEQRAFGSPGGGLVSGGMKRMYPQFYASITIVQQPGHPEPDVHVHGTLRAHVIDQAIDIAKRQIGTYESTPLDRFLEENNLRLFTTPLQGQEGVRVSLEASLRDPRSPWGLLSASGEGRTPQAARRELARTISNGKLVLGACLPISRELPVPDLAERESQE